MKFCYRDSLIDWRIVFVVIFLCALHVVTAQSNFAYVTAILESIGLLVIYVVKRFDYFLSSFLLILVSTLEYPMFVNSSLNFLPSVTMLPLVYGYFFLFLSICPFPMLIKEWRFLKIAYLNKGLSYLILFAIVTLVIGLVAGIFSIFLERTSVLFRIPFFLKDIIRTGLFSLFTLYLVFACVKYSDYLHRLRTLIFSSLVAVIISSFTISIIGIRGDYEGQPIVLMPLSFFFSTSIILFIGYKLYFKKHGLLIVVLTILSLFMQISYSNALNGKSWLSILYLFMVLLILVIRILRMKFFVILICAFILFPSTSLTTNSHSQNNSLSSDKFTQALLLVSVADIDWYENLPLSPKIRIEEFLNTLHDFTQNPFYFFVGKGFGGGHRDYRAVYGNYNPSAFSLDEYNNEYFISMHESFNVILLKFGLIGLFLLLTILCNVFRYVEFSPWLPIGGLWIILFWGYSFSLMAIGLPALVVGFSSLRYNEKKQF